MISHHHLSSLAVQMLSYLGSFSTSDNNLSFKLTSSSSPIDYDIPPEINGHSVNWALDMISDEVKMKCSSKIQTKLSSLPFSDILNQLSLQKNSKPPCRFEELTIFATNGEENDDGQDLIISTKKKSQYTEEKEEEETKNKTVDCILDVGHNEDALNGILRMVNSFFFIIFHVDDNICS